jgi:hypothetical protein
MQDGAGAGNSKKRSGKGGLGLESFVGGRSC